MKADAIREAIQSRGVAEIEAALPLLSKQETLILGVVVGAEVSTIVRLLGVMAEADDLPSPSAS